MLPKIDVFGFQIQVYGLLTLLGAIAAIIWCMYCLLYTSVGMCQSTGFYADNSGRRKFL